LQELHLLLDVEGEVGAYEVDEEHAVGDVLDGKGRIGLHLLGGFDVAHGEVLAVVYRGAKLAAVAARQQLGECLGLAHEVGARRDDMREAQSKKGTDFVAVTNHSDVGFYKFREAFENIRRAADDAMELNARNDAFSRLLVGVEIGDGIHCVDMMRRVERLCDYDVIIGSVHSTLKDGELVAYSTRDFSCESDEEIDGFMMSYFADLKKTVELGDFDILAHLTCPLRYVIGRYGRRVDMEKHRGAITEILKLIIEKGIALELNTSRLSLVLGDFVPCKEILAEYRRLGGYLVTLGSDAHVVNEASANFDAAKEHLRELGFRDVYYFKKRRAYPCRLT